MSSAVEVHSHPRIRRAPFLAGDPLTGCLMRMRHDPVGLMQSAAKMGDVVRWRFLHRPVHMVSHPDGVKHVLVDNHKNYEKQTRGYDNLRLILGNGLLTSEGEFWKRQRRIAQPAFHHRAIAGFADVMSESTTRLLDGIDTRAPETLDLDEEMMHLTLEIVGRCLFSVDLSDEADAVGGALTTVLGMAMHRISRIAQIPLWVPTPFNRKLNAAIAELDRVVLSIISERRASGENIGDLLGMLMAAEDEETGERMSDRQLRDELMTLVLAGHETTANALTWTFWLLSEHAEARAKLFEEVDALGGPPTLQDLPKLPYTEAVIKESMRLRPPAWLIGRSVEDDDEISGYAIPKNSMMFVCMYTLHRDARFWVQPERFRPERFLSSETESLPKHVYMPFGGGPRICIGNAFAMMEAQLLLATIAQRYRFDLVPGHRVEMSPVITLRPKYGMQMHAHARV